MVFQCFGHDAFEMDLNYFTNVDMAAINEFSNEK